MADVFVSYQHKDRERIKLFVKLLKRRGLSVWWDPTLVAGERFGQVIEEEIRTTKCVIVAWSANSINAPWVQDEADRGRKRRILVPLSLDGTPPPISFGVYQTPDFSDWKGDSSDPLAQQLIDGVMRLVQNGAPAPMPSQDDDEGPLRIPRRRVLQITAAAGASALAAGGWWLSRTLSNTSAPDTELSPATVPIPPTRTDQFNVTTVDARGTRLQPLPFSVEVFSLFVGGMQIEFSVIPSGQFQIGSPDSELQRQSNEGPQTVVQIQKFAMSRTAVTQDQWAALVGTAQGTINLTLPVRPSRFIGGNLPVETVSWEQATEFCLRLSNLTAQSIRLPSEAEWEYACRAGTTSAFHFGPTVTPELANYYGTGGSVGRIDGDPSDIPALTYGGASYSSGSYAAGPVGVFKKTTVPVRSYPSNIFGLFEMHGNVWEHCYDTVSDNYGELPADGRPFIGSQPTHILRGGSWSHNPAICRSAYRDSMDEDFVGWPGRVGLRLVCELT